MHQNKIADLSEICQSKFEKLEVLDLGANKIQNIPNALVYFLRNLNSLVLVNNDIFTLPPLFGFHPSLKTLSVDGNPLKSIRRNIIEAGSDTLLKFLKDKFVQGRDDTVE